MELKVPLAFDQRGDEVRPESAQKGLAYSCASCRNKVFVKKGSKKRAHFTHYNNPDYCDFARETEAHLRAKWLIKSAVESGNIPFRFLRECHRCQRIGKQPFPSGLRVKLEYLLPSGHRADVALLDTNDQIRAIIEVFETHAVDEYKSVALENYLWAEVKASTVLGRMEWPLEQDHFTPYVCMRCRQIELYGSSYPYADKTHQHVSCPVGRQKANLIDDCAFCEHFVDISDRGVFCTGSMLDGTSRQVR